MATYRINLGCHFGPLLALMALQVNRGGAATASGCLGVTEPLERRWEETDLFAHCFCG